MSAERLPPIADTDLTEEQKRAARQFESGRGYAVHGPFAVMLRSPEVMLRAMAMGDYLRFRNALPRRVSEMVILITAREWTQQFEWTYHYRYAMEAGLAREIADAISEGRRPPSMAADETAAYDFAIELLHRKGVSDATYARALAVLGERGIIDLTGICGYYSLLAMVMNVARTPADAEGAGPLAKFPM
ncbi:MAG TPA: carboxymuconolactone decarboxylase family protein [Hyphomicrobiaceae bacterium]|nr:carboxymuconolactone decarboxylase family protein [Hyphomicrobiaceae bacterium]